ncbi:hypothetical protein C8J56DRAFT_883348 [Mycena floridula]|nr:hypothetical protein C8J56DRAFT_883348 [Mycena floridula]
MSVIEVVGLTNSGFGQRESRGETVVEAWDQEDKGLGGPSRLSHREARAARRSRLEQQTKLTNDNRIMKFQPPTHDVLRATFRHSSVARENFPMAPNSTLKAVTASWPIDKLSPVIRNQFAANAVGVFPDIEEQMSKTKWIMSSELVDPKRHAEGRPAVSLSLSCIQIPPNDETYYPSHRSISSTQSSTKALQKHQDDNAAKLANGGEEVNILRMVRNTVSLNQKSSCITQQD